ncbi:radical SAM protein [Maridesulfovibrio salexigens]|uniref:Radical SAM domain protein n=1 Tax=Maridesulfovibrio salexigens (strain ATCC 14822 / DSM 2638 / NCIMB 8403 / VKM B-1763) TaxID=526222 RepID=C6BZN1_MARSD|nr:radical SAM protein [Maridesulfovibrio salexigens]ACS78938.1 Radical SAM domain protein [Maridesulfovibrio salexigens DSM 2638]
MSKLFLDGCKLFNHLDRLNAWSKGMDIAPVHVEISPTNACNYRCKFCYADYSRHKPTFIPDETLIQMMQDMGDMGVRSCLMAGDGEPLLHPALTKAITTGKNAGVDMALNTNGKLLTPEFSENNLQHLTWLRTSVMALDPDIYAELHGVKSHNISKVLSNLEAAVKIKHRDNLDVTLGIQQVLLPENAKDVYNLAYRSREIGVDYFVLKPFSLHGENEHYKNGISALALRDENIELLNKAEQLTTDTFTSIIRWNTFSDDGEREYERCYGLPFIAQVASDSKIYTCCPFFGREEFAYGDLTKASFPEIWHSESAVNLRKKIANDLDVHKECMTYCRHHQINKVLWNLKKEPMHVNFI